MRNNKPIVFLCHPYHRGGVTRWMADMAIECANNRMDVYVVTVEPVKPFFSAGKETFISLLRHNDIKVISAKVDWKFEFGTEAYRSAIYARLLRENVPAGSDVILAEDRAVWAAAERLRGLYNFVGVLHSDEEYYYQLAMQYNDLLALHICVSNRIRQNLLARDSRIDGKRVFTIPCGIQLPVFSPNTAEGSRLEILYVGRVTQYQKRVFDIPLICAVLRDKGIDFRLTVIGAGDDLGELKLRVKEKGLETCIRFLGWLKKEETLRHLQQADTLLLTSDFEGMPIAMMEALASGCGVVATKVSGVEDCTHRRYAPGCFWVFTTGDIESGAACLAESATVPKTARSQQARKLAETEFSIRHCMEKYMEAFEYIQPVRQAKPAVRLSNVDLFNSYCLSLSRYLRVSTSGRFMRSAKQD